MTSLLLVVTCGRAIADDESTPRGEAPGPTALKACLKGERGGGACLDRLFRPFLERHSTADALALIERYAAADPEFRLNCHPIVHAIGRETFRSKRTVHESFAACSQTCHSGCYHGAVERFLLGEAGDRHITITDVKARVTGACAADIPLRLRFQCLHGLGHAIMFFAKYRLAAGLEACDALTDEWSRRSCYGGVFMENVFAADPSQRDVNGDYHYPCNSVAQRYRAECYLIQTWRMSELGLSTAKLFEECGRAGEFQLICAQSIGRDLSNDARTKDPRVAADQCRLGEGDRRLACIRGAVYALIDNSWDGRFALPFCGAFGESLDANVCFRLALDYLRTVLDKTTSEVVAECRMYAASSPRCAALAER